jgi:hypothetical protein
MVDCWLVAIPDVKTQGGYQYLDDFFVGVIFSVFGTSGAGQDSVSLSAFQAAQVRARTDLLLHLSTYFHAAELIFSCRMPWSDCRRKLGAPGNSRAGCVL